MPPRKPQFEDEEETSSGSEETTSSSEEETEEEQVQQKKGAPAAVKPDIKSRTKFDDEEDDSDVVDDWEAEDSEVEREKAKKEAEAKAKAAAAAAANKKSKTQRIEEHKKANAARRAAGEAEISDEDEEDETARRLRMKAAQRDADLRHAEDLFGNAEPARGSKAAPKTLVNVDPSDPSKMADLSDLAFFRPGNKAEFEYLREKLVPLVAGNARKPQYALFLQEFCKQVAKDLPSDQIKKVASTLTALSNEKMREEKAAEKGGKKSKAAKNKTSLVASRDVASRADVEVYDDGLEEDDFM